MEGCATFPSPALPLVRYTSVAIRDLQKLPIELQDRNGRPKRSILPTREGEEKAEKEKTTKQAAVPFRCAQRPRM